jgi:hypothetical protein
LLISEECTLPENEISITDLPPGIYMVSLFSDHFFVTEKLILL